MRKVASSTIIVLALLVLLSGCGSKIEFSVPEQRVVQGDLLSIDLKNFAKVGGDSTVYFSLISGVGRVVGSKYELSADRSLTGAQTVEIAAFTKGGEPVSSKFRVTVNSKDFPPEGSIPDLNMIEGESLNLPLHVLIVDPEGSEVEYELSGKYKEGFAWIEERLLFIQARYIDSGLNELVVNAKDKNANSSKVSFVVNVKATNNAPVVAIPDQSVQEHRSLTIDLKNFVSDPDGDEITFELPAEAAGSVSSGIFTYAAGSHQEEPVTVLIKATDSKGATGEGTFKISISKAPDVAEGVLTVGAMGQYATIQEAISAAKDGDTVKILPGTYKENITVNKSITMIGTSKDEVVIQAADESSPVLFIRGVENIVIDNISFESNGSVINFSRSSGQVVNCYIAGGRFGISFSGDGKTVKVSDCYITSLMGVGNEEYLSTRLVGIYAYGEATLVVENTVFERTGTGVNFSNGLNYLVQNSIFRKNSIGVSLSGTAAGSLIGNTITENIDNGVLANITSTATISENLFYNNARHGLDLYLKSCTDCGCGGTQFRGTILGSGNIFDSAEEICPLDYWQEGFYSFDENLGKENIG